MFCYLVAFTLIGSIVGFVFDNCINHMEYCPFTLQTASYLNSMNMHIYVLTAVGGGAIAVLDIWYSYQYHRRQPR